VSFDAVEGGGVLIITRPYRYSPRPDAVEPEQDQEAFGEITTVYGGPCTDMGSGHPGFPR
jgi:hypothetical protein